MKAQNWFPSIMKMQEGRTSILPLRNVWKIILEHLRCTKCSLTCTIVCYHNILQVPLFFLLQVNPRVHPHMFLKSVVILATYLLSYYFTFYWGGSFVLSMIAAMAMGFLAAEVGICIQHDANHGITSF